jgi:hypothetical protein
VAGELRRSLSTFSSLPHTLAALVPHTPVAQGLSVGGWRIAQVSPLSLSFFLSLFLSLLLVFGRFLHAEHGIILKMRH